jgi:hypothetical protein
MDVQFARVLDAFDGPFTKIDALLPPPPKTIVGPSHPAGYLISHRVNNSFRLINRLLKAGAEVSWLAKAAEADGEDLGTGAIWVPESAQALPVLEQGAKELGVTVHAVATVPTGEARKLKPIRIGLYDRYAGSISSGWTRWLFEQYEFPFELVFPAALDAGNLNTRFDVIVFTDGSIRRGALPEQGPGEVTHFEADPTHIPAEFHGMLGGFSDRKTVPPLKKFVENGGTIVTIGSSTSLAEAFGIPVKNRLVEKGPGGKERWLPSEKFYIPGSLLRARLDNTQPLAYGMPEQVDVFYNNSPVFRLEPSAARKKTTAAGWLQDTDILDSGWAWGPQHVAGGVVFAEAMAGEGKVVLLGPEVNFRDQSHGTFKVLFNSLYSGSAKAVVLR